MTRTSKDRRTNRSMSDGLCGGHESPRHDLEPVAGAWRIDLFWCVDPDATRIRILWTRQGRLMKCPQCGKPGKRLRVEVGVQWWRCFHCKLDFSTIKLR